MIAEGIVTTLNSQGLVNIAPMGPIVDRQISQLTFRPFKTSNTYQNLKSNPCGVFHLTDDVDLIARAALDGLKVIPETSAANLIHGRVLTDCCRWYEFEILEFDDQSERTSIAAKIVHTGRNRDHFGFNRAKHAVLEATILATRLHLLTEDDVLTQLKPLKIVVEKTAGDQEFSAFDFVEDYIQQWYQQDVSQRVKD